MTHIVSGGALNSTHSLTRLYIIVIERDVCSWQTCKFYVLRYQVLFCVLTQRSSDLILGPLCLQVDYSTHMQWPVVC